MLRDTTPTPTPGSSHIVVDDTQLAPASAAAAIAAATEGSQPSSSGQLSDANPDAPKRIRLTVNSP